MAPRRASTSRRAVSFARKGAGRSVGSMPDGIRGLSLLSWMLYRKPVSLTIVQCKRVQTRRRTMQGTTRGEPHRSVRRRRGAAIAMGIAVARMLGAGESLAVPSHGADARLAFPGAVGWAAHTPGGRGGEILRVTTLAGD